MATISVQLPGLNLKNPVMPASGTFGFGDGAAAKQFDLNKLGAMVLKTTTPQARTGNPQPQIALLADGSLNAVGLTNPGVQAVADQKVPTLHAQFPHLPLIASVGGASIEDYVVVAQKLTASNLLNALEINLSCPNVSQGGMTFGIHPAAVEKITAAVKTAVNVPVYVKLTPNVTSMVEIAKAAESGGADGLSMINTVTGMQVDIKRRRPLLGNNFGGLSGNAVKSIALYQIFQVHLTSHLPIIGMGGVSSAEDVVAFMLAGASAVAVGSAHFQDPLACLHIIEKLPSLLDQLGVQDIKELVGAVELN